MQPNRTATLPSLFLLFASSSAWSQEVLWQWDGSGFHDSFGWAVELVSSLDGDGHAEVLVGAYAHDSGFMDTGQATLYSGATGIPLFQVVGPDPFARVGISLSSGGLVDGDGVADFLIGADMQDTSGGLNSGRVCVYSGATLGVLRCHDGEGPNQGFGGARGVKVIGDIDLDGADDYVVGASGYADFFPFQIGKVYVYSGLSGALLRELMGENECDFFGLTTSGMGDLDADGVPDFLVHARLSLLGGATKGRVYAYSGSDFSLLWTLSGHTPGQALGQSLDNVGDVDQDGVCDFIAGWQVARIGHATVYSGADRSVIYSHAGKQQDDNFGQFGTASVDDVNRDGYPDYVVSAWARNSRGLTRNGAVFLYSGRTGTLLYRFEGNLEEEQMGISEPAGRIADSSPALLRVL